AGVDGVPAGTARDRVVALAGVDGVVAGTAVDGARLPAGGDRVVAGAALHGGPAAGLHRGDVDQVVATAAVGRHRPRRVALEVVGAVVTDEGDGVEGEVEVARVDVLDAAVGVDVVALTGRAVVGDAVEGGAE